MNEKTINVISVDMGWRHLAYIHMEVSLTNVKIYEWKVVDVLTNTNVDNINTSTIEQLVNLATPKIFELVKIWTDKKPDIVYLEQQPLGVMSKNIKTKILSHIFQSLLVSQNFLVKFISPKRKLDGLLDRKYTENKKFAVSTTEEKLKELNLTDMLTFFCNYTEKKDDLADCFLQGYYGAINDIKVSSKKTRQKKIKKIKEKRNLNIKTEF